MDDHELDLLRRHPQWKAVLNFYQQLEEAGRLASPDFDGWVGRVHDVPGVTELELPGIHGKLIAFGFLKFDLAGRDGGIRYQLTRMANQEADQSTESEAGGHLNSRTHALKLAEPRTRAAG